MKLAALTSLLIATTLVSACSSVAVDLPPVPRAPIETADGSWEYRLQPGDVLETVYPAAIERNQQVVVAPDGHINVAYAPNIAAGGHTLPEVTQAIVGKAKIIDPGFTVTLRSSVGLRVYVTGEVTNPGEVVVDGPLTALQAVSRAGGFKETTAQTGEVVLMRREQGDRPKLYAMNLEAAADGKDPGEDAKLQPYDIIYVPRDRIANVSLVFERVRQAIPFSFGFSYTGNGVTGF